MSKFCIFCGNKPENKTREHVIPQWLIKMTDHKDRKTTFGIGSKGQINFPWMRYTFPACKVCNENYSNLEGRVKPIIENLFSYNEITQVDIIDLLDWFDKVRIGIWLGQSLLSGEKLNPNFHINQRVGISDRLLVINQSIEKGKRITFTGTESLAFKFSPSCFALTINELTFFNYSSAFLLSENMGFPYPVQINTHPDGKLEVLNISKGKLKITRPLLDGKIINPSIKIYQTILNTHGGNIIEDPIPEYITENSIRSTLSNIQSNPFIIDDFSDFFNYLKIDETISFKLKGGYPKEPLMNSTAIIVFNHQNYEIERALKTFKHLPDKERNKQTEFYNYVLTENKKLIAKLEK